MNNTHLSRSCRAAVALVLLPLALAAPGTARACPFCSAVSLTFAQEIAQSQVAVVARLVEPPEAASLLPRADGPLPKGRFAVVEALKGGELLEAADLVEADGLRLVETIMLETKPAGSTYLLLAVEPPKLVWSSPIPVSERGIEYLRRLGDLPAKGPDRLAFFQKHLEDADDTLARDAYDEFAVAPYEDVRGLESRMDPTQLLTWIEDPKVPANRRRLYATMLGVCGTKADADRIAAILEEVDPPKERREVRTGLDALIACYATLKGPEGLDLVDALFIDRTARRVPFTETYAAVMALRFLGEESSVIPRERVLESLRRLLADPKLADLVIADLARWEDWSVIDRLAELFEKADDDNLFVREPIVNYLKSCPDPRAVDVLARLEKIDPEAFRRAATLGGIAAALAAKPAAPDGAAGAAPPAPAGSTAGGAPAGGDSAEGDPADGDPGEPAGATLAAGDPAAGTAPAGDLAARLPKVLGDEDATDDRAPVDPAGTAPPAPKAQGATAAAPSAPSIARWFGIGAAVGLLAFLARRARRASRAA